MSEVLDRITTLLTDKFNVPADRVRSDVSFADLEVDSLALAELAVILEKEYGVRLTEDEATPASTPGQVAEVLAAKIGDGSVTTT